MSSKIVAVKTLKFDLHDKGYPQVIIKYTTTNKNHLIEVKNIFIHEDYIKDEKVFMFANFFYTQDLEQEEDLTALYYALNLENEYTIEKSTEIRTSKIAAEIIPINFIQFTKEIKEKWFNTIIKKYVKGEFNYESV